MKTLTCAAIAVLAFALSATTAANAHQHGDDYGYDAYAPKHGTLSPTSVLGTAHNASEPVATATGGPAGGLPDKN